LPISVLISPSDYRLMREAKRRGNPQAIERLARILAARVVANHVEREALAAALIADDGIDNAWPPAHLTRKP
jgi:hypothetical protein